MNPKAVGQATEAMVIARLLARGSVVLLPYGDNERYDLVLEEYAGRPFVKVQCKTARLVNGCIEFNAYSSYAHRGRGTTSYREDADYFGVYAPALDQCYMVPVEEVGITKVRLRVESPKRGPDSASRWAKQYVL